MSDDDDAAPVGTGSLRDRLGSTSQGVTLAVSDARCLKVDAQTRTHRGVEGTCEGAPEDAPSHVPRAPLSR